MVLSAITCEHPYHALSKISAWQTASEPCALVIITETQGGAVRAPGAMLAVSTHEAFGYISGGCIDADVILQARQTLEDGQVRALRYGAGSPFVDLPLPCGGAIDLIICPNPERAVIAQMMRDLSERRPTTLYVTQKGALAVTPNRSALTERLHRFDYHPPVRLRIAGRGADALTLATIAQAAGHETRLQLLDEQDIDAARKVGLSDVQALTTVSQLPEVDDDPWTAFVLLFHDRDLEIPLLKQALAGPAFYIGAVGSRHTHAKRCEALKDAGCTTEEISRIHGPIGLVPSLRDASAIALSTLAEIIEAAQQIPKRRDDRTAFVLLAAGRSKRFEDGDKLLSDLDGQAVLARTAQLLFDHAPGAAIAIVGDKDRERTSLLTDAGWETVENPNSELGQATSIKRAINGVISRPNIDQVLILLGDMPRVPSAHVTKLLETAKAPQIKAIMSACDGVLSPPAVFKRDLFEDLLTLTGDRGAKSVFEMTTHDKMTVPLSAAHGADIDCVADLLRAMESEHA